MSLSPSMSLSRSLVVFALLEVPLPGPRPRLLGTGAEEEFAILSPDTGVAAPDGLALISSK